MKPKFITFTGVDSDSSLKQMIEVSDKYPVEWGILFSPSNKDIKYELGQAYVNRDTLLYLPSMSAHLCGGYAREVLETGKSSLDLSMFDRVQINASARDYKGRFGTLLSFQNSLNKSVILQHREEFPVCSNVWTDSFNLLYDCSGGKGIVAEQFPKDPGYFVGFAGGFSPDNIIEQLNKIDCKDYYIDMEGAIRTNNYFDLNKVRSVLEQIYDN